MQRIQMIGTVVALIAVMGLTAQSSCSDAEVASRNLSLAADNFEIMRRVVFLNGITDTYLLAIEGLCAIDDQGRQLEVTCETAPSQYKKHFLGLSDNVTCFAEQVDAVNVGTHHYRVIFKPQTILPDIDFRGDAGELLDMTPSEPR